MARIKMEESNSNCCRAECGSVNILAVMPNELHSSGQHEHEGGRNGLPVLGTCLNSESVSNVFQNQHIFDARVNPESRTFTVTISFIKKHLAIARFSDFSGILFTFFLLWQGTLQLWLWAYHLSSMLERTASPLTWLASLSAWFWSLHKYAFYVWCVQSCEYVCVRCHKNGLYQFLLVCLSLSPSQMLVLWCNDCAGVCYRSFKVALWRRAVISSEAHCILQRSQRAVSLQVREVMLPMNMLCSL